MITDCDNCGLDRERFVPTQFSGPNPDFMFVGEAPGADEVVRGRPFIGRAGKIIRAVTEQLGLDNDSICWANTCSCRPPENRTPTAAEMRCCLPRLKAEIEQVNPKVIVCMGVVPSRALIPKFRSITKSRGMVQDSVTGHKVISTFHPAAALYRGGDKIIPSIASDIQTAKDFIDGRERKYSDPETQVVIVDTVEKMEALVNALDTLEPNTLVATDWETTGLRNGHDVGWCIGLAWIPGKAVSVPISMIREYLPFFKWFYDPKRTGAPKFVGYNAQFDLGFFQSLGIDMEFSDDAMLLHYCLDERPQQRSLENVTVDRLNAPRYEEGMLARYNTKKGSMWQDVPIDEIMMYCAKDCDWTLRLFLDLMEEAEQTPSIMQPYKKLLIPAIPVFKAIDDQGLWVDRERHAALMTQYKTKVEELEVLMKEITGNPDFNPRSHPQVQEALWDDLMLQQPRLKKRKPRSVDKATREALLKKYPQQELVVALNDYSKIYTYYSRYIRPLPQFFDKGDGRVRPNYHFDRTETGRLSATSPGIHQIPRDSDIRSMYGAPPRKVLVQADYSQLELRMAAHIARDSNMTAIVNRTDVDFHKLMASQAFKVPVEAVTPDQRQKSKPFTFGVLYFMSDATLAQQSGLSIADASEVATNYWAMMPDVKAWTADIRRQVRENHYVKSIFGRRRRFPLITRENFDALHREAVNMPIQSSASDLTLYNVIRLHHRLQAKYPEAHIVIMVHDSIIVECPLPIAEEVAALVRCTMTEDLPFNTDVRFPVEIKIGRHWGEGEVWA